MGSNRVRSFEPTARDSGSSDFSTPWGLASIGVVVVAGALQFREALLPILSGPDEPYRIDAAFDQWLALVTSDAGFLTTALALVSAFVLWLAGLTLLSGTRPLTARLGAGAGLLIVGFASNYHLMLAVGTRWGGSPRWPPLGTLFEVLAFSVFGPGELAARIPSLVFFLLTGVLLFRFVAFAATPMAGFVAVASVFSSPTFLTQGQLASRETGGAFFMAAGAYFLLRWWQFGRNSDLGLVIASTLAAYLTRRPAIVFVLVVVAFLMMDVWRKWRAGGFPDLRAAVTRAVVGLGVLVAGALPWMFSTRTIRPFEFSPSNWIDWGLVTAYPAHLPGAVGLVVTVFGTIGLVAAVSRPRVFTSLALLWFGVLYLLFTSDTPRWIPTWRFFALMSPAWAVLAAGGFEFLSNRFARPARVALVAIFVAGAAASVGAWVSCAEPPSWLSMAPCRGELARYPFDRVAMWLERNEPGRVVVTPGTYWQTSLGAYVIFNGLEGISEFVPAYDSLSPPLERRDVIEACRVTRADFVVVPHRRASGEWAPLFAAPEEAGSRSLPGGPEAGEKASFTNGNHRLVLWSCSELGGP